MSVLSPTFEYVAVLQCMSSLRPCPAESHRHFELLDQVVMHNSTCAAGQIHLCPYSFMQEIAQARTAGLASAAQDGQREQQRRREGV